MDARYNRWLMTDREREEFQRKRMYRMDKDQYVDLMIFNLWADDNEDFMYRDEFEEIKLLKESGSWDPICFVYGGAAIEIIDDWFYEETEAEAHDYRDEYTHSYMRA